MDWKTWWVLLLVGWVTLRDCSFLAITYLASGSV